MSVQLEGQTVSRDERGLISVQIPFYVATLDETMTVSGGNPFGLPETNRQVSQIEGLGYQVVLTYEGSEGTDDGDAEEGTYEFDSSFKEEPLESHPFWPDIKAKFSGSIVDKEVTFPESLPQSQLSKAGLTGNEPAKPVKNPMFGVKTYLALYSVFRRTYVKKKIPKGLLESVGTTKEKLPGGLSTPKGRNWLVMPPKIRKRGNSWEISEELTLSKPGEKWPPSVYRLIAK
jgi:hypothetical protein